MDLWREISLLFCFIPEILSVLIQSKHVGHLTKLRQMELDSEFVLAWLCRSFQGFIFPFTVVCWKMEWWRPVEPYPHVAFTVGWFPQSTAIWMYNHWLYFSHVHCSCIRVLDHWPCSLQKHSPQCLSHKSVYFLLNGDASCFLVSRNTETLCRQVISLEFFMFLFFLMWFQILRQGAFKWKYITSQAIKQMSVRF